MMRIVLYLLSLLIAVSESHAPNIQKETFVYSVKDGKELRLDRYIDVDIDSKGKRPVMVYVHGGGWKLGSRSQEAHGRYIEHFAKLGFISVAIDYRLGLQGVKMNWDGSEVEVDLWQKARSMATEDLIDATLFLLEQEEEWNLDPELIVISGGSAGAVSCLNAMYEICSGGALAARLPRGFNYAGVVSHAGAIIVDHSPLKWKKTPPPVLFFHGSEDEALTMHSAIAPGFSYAGSNYLHEEFVKRKYPHWLYIEEGADHVIAKKALTFNFGELDTFIDKFVMKRQNIIAHTSWQLTPPASQSKKSKDKGESEVRRGD